MSLKKFQQEFLRNKPTQELKWLLKAIMPMIGITMFKIKLAICEELAMRSFEYEIKS